MKFEFCFSFMLLCNEAMRQVVCELSAAIRLIVLKKH